MSGWRATPALSRACLVALAALVVALVVGRPWVAVLGSGLLLPALLGLLGRPTGRPRLSTSIGLSRLHEGQGTAVRLRLEGHEGAEHVARVASPVPHVVLRPRHGTVGAVLESTNSGAPEVVPGEIAVSPRRWGRRTLGVERIALTSPWAGFRHGPVEVTGHELLVWPQQAVYDSRAEVPAPLGLVGAHRSRRVGGGTDLAGIRPFTLGDRLRRIDWRVSLREGELHVVTTHAEEDAAVLVVVDALSDVGVSEGVEGSASSLDVGVRAAASLAEHHGRVGDRVALRVVSPAGGWVPFGSGPRHLRRLVTTLARIRPEVREIGEDQALARGGLTGGATGATVVYVLSPMLQEQVVTATAALVRSGVTVVVVDTLAATGGLPVLDRTTRGLAWRMRTVERDAVLRRLAALGCPVVAWRGPGTVDEVLRRLARRGQVPQVRIR